MAENTPWSLWDQASWSFTGSRWRGRPHRGWTRTGRPAEPEGLINVGHRQVVDRQHDHTIGIDDEQTA